jgi:hypothetical protein
VQSCNRAIVQSCNRAIVQSRSELRRSHVFAPIWERFRLIARVHDCSFVARFAIALRAYTYAIKPFGSVMHFVPSYAAPYATPCTVCKQKARSRVDRPSERFCFCFLLRETRLQDCTSCLYAFLNALNKTYLRFILR